MAEPGQQVHPISPQSEQVRTKPPDEEAAAAMVSSEELRHKKRMKWLLYIVAFVIFQTGIIVLFTFTVMKVRTPKFRVRPSSIETFNVQTTNPSFNLEMNAQLGVKNTNFGPYKYGNSTIFFYYRGTEIGKATVPKSKAQFRRTKKINLEVDLASPANLGSNSVLASDISAGILPLTAKSRLNGKVELMFIFKKKKAIDLDCSMDLNTSTKQLQNIKCK